MNREVIVTHTDSERWLEYFRQNANQLLEIPWEIGPELSATEKQTIASSVRIFQLGESSEGRHLIKCATDYANRRNNAAYVEAIRFFIKEEQRHARELGRFLKLNGETLLKQAFTDSVFRKLRQFANLELSITVLVTAEIIAQVYYPALMNATRSEILKAICQQIVADESAHVEFQTQTIALLRKSRSPFQNLIANILHSVLYWSACLVIWPTHRKVFIAGGLPFPKYLTQAHQKFKAALHTINTY